ncbi:hypothetical protein, partial [Acinetobacter stercoris]|uniref:hypothetical protein n=1 Tax=Acinetobacter stercoris TaxID=2126983 RepID=UPI001BC886F6
TLIADQFPLPEVLGYHYFSKNIVIFQKNSCEKYLPDFHASLQHWLHVVFWFPVLAVLIVQKSLRSPPHDDRSSSLC